jgi:pimeloyl-ACP methyl ester carboxylesterase
MDAGRSSETSNHEVTPAAATSGYVEAGGLKLHYLDYGRAGLPAMLCVHGGAAHAHWFDFVAAGFSGDYHVRALDQRGHGDSAWSEPPDYTTARLAEDLHDVAEQLDLRDYVLVAHSMGGMVALNYAARFPGRLGRLIVVDSTLRLTDDRAAMMRERGARQSSYGTLDDLAARYKLMPSGSSATPAVVNHIAHNAGRLSADGRWRHKFDRNVYTQRGSVDGIPCFANIRVPTLLVKGESSPRISPEIFAEVKAVAPHVELAEVAASGHHVTLDNPAGFVEVVRAFLARHP